MRIAIASIGSSTFHLEAAGERGVLLEVLLVLGPGGGRDGAELAARQRGLEQVGGVVLALGTPRPDQLMGLIDEHDDRCRGVLDLSDHLLQAVLELALDTGAGLKESQVQAPQHHVLQRLGHVAVGDALGEALHHRRLSDPGLAGENGVVLTPTGQDVDDLADLRLAAEHGIDAPVSGLRREIRGVLIQGGGGRGTSRPGCRQVALGGICDGTHLPVFEGAPHDLDEVLLEDLDVDVLDPLVDVEESPAQAGVVERGEQQTPGAHPGQPVVHRTPHPGLPSQRLDILRQIGAAAVAGLQRVESAVQVPQQAVR